MLRLLNLCVIGLLVAAAVYVYRIKYETTDYAGRIAKLKIEIAKERESIADLKAVWADYNRPERLQALAEKHLKLQPMAIPQIGSLEGLPEKPAVVGDPIGAMLEAMEKNGGVLRTGSVPPNPTAGPKPGPSVAAPRKTTDKPRTLPPVVRVAPPAPPQAGAPVPMRRPDAGGQRWTLQ